MILEDELLNSNIMVVDDEPANVQLLLRALENEGFTSIKSTTDPREAVDMYQSFSFIGLENAFFRRVPSDGKVKRV